MRGWIKNNYKMILVVLAFVIIGPIIINCLFKLHPSREFFVAEWDASAMLSYYGTIIAAVIAIYGIFITIRYSQKSYKDDVRDRTMPFIVIDMLKTRSRTNLFKSKDTKICAKQVEGYYEYKLTDYYCILENGVIRYSTGLTKTQQELLDNGGMRWVYSENGGSLQVVDDICVPFEFENVGNGAAIRMRYGLNRKETIEHDRKYLPVLSLKPNTPMMFHLFSENCSENSENLGRYVLSFYYDDIYSNSYEQYFEISIEYDKEKKRPVCSIDMSHVQKFLERKNSG